MLLLDKPRGITSNGALQEVKHLFEAAKAGHTGSLDPLATGALPLCFGEATKFSQFLLNADKRYLAQVYGAYDSEFADKLDYDLLYLEKMSLWLDCKLLIISVWKTLLGRWEMGSPEGNRAHTAASRLKEDR